MRDECAGNRITRSEPHHHDDGDASRTNSSQGAVQTLTCLTGQHQEPRCHVAVRDRNARSLWRGNRGGHAGNDLDGDTGLREHEHLFRASAEHEWIAAFQPHDAFALPRGANHQAIDRFLFDTRSTGALANTKALRVCQTTQRFGIDERIVQNKIGLFDAPQSAKRPKLRIARTGTHQ